MDFRFQKRPVSLSNGDRAARPPEVGARSHVPREGLCPPLLERLDRGRDQAAFEFLARETSLDVVNGCLLRIPDQQITEYLLELIFLSSSLLTSEAFTGIEGIRRELKALPDRVKREDPRASRRAYDSRVEKLGRHFFALGRRLLQLEQFMTGCPLTGSGEQIRGRYGQRVRDLAGDVRFMRQELGRWVRRFVPLKRTGPGQGEVDREFLEGRIDAVIDELGLRIREVHETLSACLFEQLSVFDRTLTRQKLFRRDLENVLDLGQLLESLSNLFDRVQEFDEARRADQLARVKTLLEEFHPQQFLAFSGVRESDQVLFESSIEELKRYRLESFTEGEEDPIKVFLLLTGDVIASLRRQQRHRDVFA